MKPRIKRRSKREKLHSAAMLATKKSARALGIAWAAVCEERDRLRTTEMDQRDYMEQARQVAWSYFLARTGRSSSARAFWRNGFQKTFAAKIAAGADYLVVPYADEIASTVREHVPEFIEVDSGEIFDILLAPYEPRTTVDALYPAALANVIAGRVQFAAIQSVVTPF